jgi:hypothetical protein
MPLNRIGQLPRSDQPVIGPSHALALIQQAGKPGTSGEIARATEEGRIGGPEGGELSI